MATRLALDVHLTVPPGMEVDAARQAYAQCPAGVRAALVRFAAAVVLEHEGASGQLVVVGADQVQTLIRDLPKL